MFDGGSIVAVVLQVPELLHQPFYFFLHPPRFIDSHTTSSTTFLTVLFIQFMCIMCVLAQREILINVWKPAQGTMISSTVILTNAAINKHFQEDTQLVRLLPPLKIIQQRYSH